jgi:cystathionine beta-lyase
MSRFDKVISREGTNAVKTELRQMIFGRQDIIPMWIADMDFPSPEPVTQAILERAKHPMYGYTARPKNYFQPLCDWQKRRHGWTVEKSHCFHSPSVLASLSAAVHALTPPNAEIAIQTPVYAPFYSIISRNQRRVAENPLVRDSDGKYVIDFENLESHFARGVRFFLFCSPHNPVGRVWTQKELETLANLALRYEVTIFSDEIHCDLVYQDYKHIPFASLSPEISERTLTCVSPTKTFNLAGLSVSAIIASNSTMRGKVAAELFRCSIDDTHTFGIVAFETAFRDCEPWLHELMVYLENNRNLIAKTLRPFESKVRCYAPEGTYLAWLDFSKTRWNPEVLAKNLITNAGVALEPGSKFGSMSGQFSRLNFACPEVTLKEGLDRIVNMLQEHT